MPGEPNPQRSDIEPAAPAADHAPPDAARRPVMGGLVIAALLLVGGGAYLATRSNVSAPESMVSVPVPAEPRPPAPTAVVPAPVQPPKPEPVVVVPAPEPSVPAPAPSGCARFKGDHAAAMRAKEYDCVRGILLPRLHAGTMSGVEARYLKAACAALADVACQKKADTLLP